MEINKEEWKPIIGYEGLYEISSHGRVKSLGHARVKKERILSKRIDSYGYCSFILYCNGKSKSHLVHRLVAIHFLENPYNKPQVNHKDGNKENNNVENLEWTTNKENVVHRFKVLKHRASFYKKLSDEVVNYIRVSDKSCNALGKELNISSSSIQMIRAGESYRQAA